MASLAQLAMALEAVHASAAANTLSLDEEDFGPAGGSGGGGGSPPGGGRPLAPLASLSLGAGVAGACTLRSNDFDDDRDIDDCESEFEKGEVLRFLGGGGGRSAVAGVGSNGNKNSSSSSVISSAMLFAAASGAAPSPWLTPEEEEKALTATSAAGERGREAVGV